MIYGIPYVVAGLMFTFVGVRQSAIVVGLLWLLHGLYDLVHGRLITNPAFPVGTPSGVVWLMLSSARTFCGYRGVFPTPTFAGVSGRPNEGHTEVIKTSCAKAPL
jgi:hypothetical protein